MDDLPPLFDRPFILQFFDEHTHVPRLGIRLQSVQSVMKSDRYAKSIFLLTDYEYITIVVPVTIE